MIVEVFKGVSYIIIVAKDKDDRVFGVIPISAKELFKNRTEVKENIKKFFRNIDRLPPSRVVFYRSMPLLMKIISDSLRELDEEIKKEYEEEVKKQREVEKRVISLFERHPLEKNSLENHTRLLKENEKV